jgi:FtsP/CotA-like multicopper oxidase with cupredoxin domain
MDGITVANMYRLKTGEPLVMGPGQRMDVLVKAGEPGTYRLHTQDPANPDFAASVSPSGIAPAARNSRHSFDFPTPCAKPGTAVDSGLVDLETAGVDDDAADHGSGDHGSRAPNNPCKNMVTYPITLATVIVEGSPLSMDLPAGSLPVPAGLPSVAKMLETTPDANRNVAFELCGNKEGTIMQRAGNRLPSCGWYYAKYADSWGGRPFNNLQMMRDADDEGKPNPVKDRFMPSVDFKKDGIFNPAEPLFKGMVAGNYEEWTIINRTYSDHPFHIHQNPFLVTEINGVKLPIPEWHDTIIVPGTEKQPTNFLPPPHQPNINKIEHGSITFRIYFNPITVGCFVMHCHILNHEDMSMMQRLDILPARGQPSGCVLPPPTMDH